MPTSSTTLYRPAYDKIETYLDPIHSKFTLEGLELLILGWRVFFVPYDETL